MALYPGDQRGQPHTQSCREQPGGTEVLGRVLRHGDGRVLLSHPLGTMRPPKITLWVETAEPTLPSWRLARSTISPLRCLLPLSHTSSLTWGKGCTQSTPPPCVPGTTCGRQRHRGRSPLPVAYLSHPDVNGIMSVKCFEDEEERLGKQGQINRALHLLSSTGQRALPIIFPKHLHILEKTQISASPTTQNITFDLSLQDAAAKHTLMHHPSCRLIQEPLT